MAFEAWLFALMMAFVPPDRSITIPSHPETVQQRTQRYRSIAHDIVLEVQAQPKPLPGLSRRQTMALVLAVGIGESGLAPDADYGPCYREGLYRGRCDAGRSVTMWQLMLPRKLHKQYFGDRRQAIRYAMRIMRLSMQACRHREMRHRLAAYCSGSCNKGGQGSAARWGLFVNLLNWKPKPKGRLLPRAFTRHKNIPRRMRRHLTRVNE